MSARRKHLPEHNVERQAEAARGVVAMLAQTGADEDTELVCDMIEGETGFLDALDMAISAIRDCDVIASGCAAEIDKLSARKRRAESRKDALRACIEQAMLTAGVETLALPTKTLSIRHTPPQVIVEDFSLIPSAYFVPQEPRLDKKALNAAAQNAEIPGTRMTNGGISLTIRSK